MKIQHLAVIFCIIIIPVTMILSYYIGTQTKTINLQTSYDTKLMDATHDAIVAFQKNTINNAYSTVADSQKRDVQASINTFFTSLSNNLGVSGYTKEYIQPYVPAILFTMYDGYYVYAPTSMPKEDDVDGDGEKEYVYDDEGNLVYEAQYVLKPYVYYAERYTDDSRGIDVVINYSLDNYISIYGTVEENEVKKTISRAGYLVKIASSDTDDGVYKDENDDYYYNGIQISSEKTSEQRIKENEDGTKTIEKYSNDNNGDAIEYYKEAYDFSEWVYRYTNLMTLEIPGTYTKFGNGKIFDGNPEQKSSNFEQHKREVIRNSIISNLQSAINNYAGSSTYNFKIPIFTAEDWEKIYTNVSMVSLLQGLPVGTKIYNNYSIVTSTGNDKYIAPEELYFVTYDFNGNEDTYHRINCPNIDITNGVTGYKSIDFERRYQEVTDLNTGKKTTQSYYKHTALACYECIVGSNITDSHNDDGDFIISKNNYTDAEYKELKKAYYLALARERYNLDKATKFINSNIH